MHTFCDFSIPAVKFAQTTQIEVAGAYCTQRKSVFSQ